MDSSAAPDTRIVWPPGHAPASAVVYAKNTVDIAAPAAVVWSLLVDCTRWPAWYEHCSDVSVIRGGSKITADGKFRFKTLGFYFEPEVTTFEPERMLVWSAKGPAGTSGSPAWYIEPTSGGCRVITEETQKGALLRIIGRRAARNLHAAHEDWLTSLRALSEGEVRA